MNREFQIGSRRSACYLHIYLRGDFTGMCAWNFYKFLRKNRASRRVLVNTHDIQLKTHMPPNLMPKEGLYFKGENGFRIGPDGSRALLCRKTPKEKRSSKSRAAPGFKCISGNQGIQPGKRARSFVRNSNCVFQPIKSAEAMQSNPWASTATEPFTPAGRPVITSGAHTRIRDWIVLGVFNGLVVAVS